MPNVRLFNNNKFDHTEKFKGDIITIKAGDCVEMDLDDAVLFMGQFCPMRFKADGIQDPRSYKMLAIDPDDLAKARSERDGIVSEKLKNTFVCHMCEKEFRTKNGLIKHVKQNHMEDLADDETRDELDDMDTEESA